MDYGQPSNNPNQTPFFTGGVGNVPEKINPDPNSLNDEDNSWQSRNSGDIGSKVLGFTGSLEIENPDIHTNLMQKRFAKVVDLTPPPTMSSNPDGATPKKQSFDPKLIRTDDRRGISSQALTKIKELEIELNQDGNATEFYDAIRGDEHNPGMMRENLKNSYHREVA